MSIREGMETSKPRVLITGGAGFIGSHLAERLLSLGYSVVCLDNFDPYYPRKVKQKNIEEALKSPCFTLLEGDIRDRDLVKKIFAEQEIEWVFHGAARAGVRPSLQNPFLYEEVNIRGTLNLLDCAVEHQISNFVFASSSSVYGENPKVPFSESDPADHPISPYAATKKAGELLCYSFHHLYKLPVTCLRFFTVYGPRQRPEMAIHKFVRLISQGLPIPFYGDGSSRRDYTYIGDAIDGIVAALEQGHSFEVINIGEATTISLSQLVSLLGEQMGVEVTMESHPFQAGDVPQTWADLTKAKQLLNYEPKTDMQQGLQLFLKWFRKVGEPVCES